MNIFPAIDLLGGKAVRLYKGDYNQVTVYNDDPASVAADFERAGAKFLHLVDLDGAKNGSPTNLDTIRRIVSSTNFKFVTVSFGNVYMPTPR